MEKTLPSNLEAEKALIGGILSDNSSLIDALDFVVADDFYSTLHHDIFQKMVEMQDNEQPIDLITLSNNLKGNSLFEASDIGCYYLTGCVQMGGMQVGQYAKIVRQKSLLRQAILKMEEVKKEAFEHTATGEFDIVLENAHSALGDLIALQPSKEFDIEREGTQTVLELKEPPDTIPWFYEYLDKYSGGVVRGEITVIAARPGQGKTTFVTQEVQNWANNNYKVCFFSLEMQIRRIMQKMLSNLADVSSFRMKIRELVKDDFEELETAIEKLNGYKDKIWIFDDVYNMSSIVKISKKYKPDIIVIDFLQLFSFDEANIRFEINNILRKAKRLAKQLNCCIVCVSQMSRAIEQRADKRPRLSDLAESGGIEQLAGDIIFLYYPFKYEYPEDDEEAELMKGKVEFIYAKARYGETGRLYLKFDGDKARFTNLVREEWL